MWSFYSQSLLIALIVNVFLVVIVLRNNPGRRLNRSFIFPSAAYFLWVSALLLNNFFDLPVLVHLIRSFVLFLPVAVLHFLLIFLRNRHAHDWRLLRFAYGTSSVFTLLFFRIPWESEWPSLITIFYSLPVVVLGFSILYKRFSRSVSRLERYHIVYIFLGSMLWMAGIIIDVLNLPASSVYPLSVLGGLAFLGVASWSIVRLRFIDISVLTGKILVYIILILVLALFYFLFSQSWPETPFSQLLKVVLAVVLFVLVYEPIMRKVEEWSNKVLQRESFDLIRKLIQLNKSLLTIIDKNQVYLTFLKTLVEAEKIANISLFIREKDDDDFYPLMSPYFPTSRLRKIEQDKPIIRFLERNPRIIERDAVEREMQMAHRSQVKKQLLAIYRTLAVLDAEMCIPIMFQNRIRGFILLKTSESSSPFNRRERELFSLVADQIGIITENARLYALMKKKDGLAAIGQLSTGLAHEIRNPLGALKATAQHLESLSDDPELQEFLQIIIDEVNRLNDVVVRFLNFAHPLKLRPNKTQLNSLITRTINLLKNQPTWEDITFHLRLTDEVPELELDENQIKQVLLNLILNAQQAMPEGGTISISTSIHGETPSMKTEVQADKKNKHLPRENLNEEKKNLQTMTNGRVELSIEDTGEGIPAEDIDKIFNPFYTTKDSGSGLGLSIVHRIIETHGGTISVSSRTGSGTRFTITFPCEVAEYAPKKAN